VVVEEGLETVFETSNILTPPIPPLIPITCKKVDFFHPDSTHV